MIPKIIHYCWFGNNPKPKIISKCIESWEKYCPDWKIIEWNEKNYDVNKAPYIKSAYEQKKWAFVSDYARFDILNTYGGVYLDTDVELLKPIPDSMLELEGFMGFESAERVAPGLIYASIAGQSVLSSIICDYNGRSFSTDKTVVDIVTDILTAKGLVGNNTQQNVDGVEIYPTDYFCCFNFETQLFTITERTISIHHYCASWTSWRRKLHFAVIKRAAMILGEERYLKLKRKVLK